MDAARRAMNVGKWRYFAASAFGGAFGNVSHRLPMMALATMRADVNSGRTIHDWLRLRTSWVKLATSWGVLLQCDLPDNEGAARGGRVIASALVGVR